MTSHTYINAHTNVWNAKCTAALEELSFFSKTSQPCWHIDAILNSRPIKSVSNDAKDAVALSPRHFLIVQPITTLPNSKTTGKETLSWERQTDRMDNLIRFLEEVVNRILSNVQQQKKMANGTNKYWHQWSSNNQGREQTTHSVANGTINKGLW